MSAEGGLQIAEVFSERGRIWDRRPDVAPASGLISIIKNLKSELFVIQAAAFNSRGDKIATVDQRGSVYLFHISSNRYALVARSGVSGTAISFAPGPKNELLVAYADGTINVFSTEHKYEVVATLKNTGHKRSVDRVQWHRSSQAVLTTSADCVCLWDACAWKKIRTLALPSDPITQASTHVMQASFVPSDEKIMTCLSDDSLLCWERSTFKLMYRLTLPQTPRKRLHLRRFAITDDGKYLLAGGASRYLALYELTNQTFVRLLALPSSVNNVNHIEFMHGSEVAVLHCDDSKLRFVHILNRRVVLQIAPALDAWLEDFSLGGGVYPVSVGGSSPAAGIPRVFGALRMRDGSVHMHDISTALEHSMRTAAQKAVGGDGDRDEDACFEHVKVVPLGDLAAAHTIGAAVDTATSHAAPAVQAPRPSTAKSKSRAKRLDSDSDASDSLSVHASKRSQSTLETMETTPLSGATNTGVGSDPSLLLNNRWVDADSADHKILNADKLRKLLQAHGEYPARYRLMIWKYMLRVPDNAHAFENLVARGLHPAWKDLAEQYPIPDRKLFRRLQRALSALSHWSPIFAEVSYLPALVFPFVRLFEAEDECAAFEIVACVLLNWSRRWFEFWPHAPVSLLRQCEAILEHHDPALLQHLRSFAATPQSSETPNGGANANALELCVWPVLRSLLTELLPKTEWLRTFDHVFSNDSPFLCYLSLAYLVYFRTALMRVTSVDDLHFFLHHQNALNLADVLLLAYKVQAETPVALQLPTDAWIPLPRGPVYPIYNYYPKFVVDFQLKERERIADEERQVEQRRHIMEELQKRSDALLAEQQAWAAKQAALSKAEDERRARWLIEEEARQRKQERIDQETTYRRLQQISLMEQAVQSSWSERERLREIEWRRLEDEMNHKREREDYELKRRVEEEALLNLEFQMNQRVTSLQQQKDAESAQSQLRREATLITEQTEASKKLRAERWRIEDEERRIRAQIAREQAEKLHAFNETVRDQRALDQQKTLAALQAEFELAAVERERRLRHLTQDELERADADALQRRQREEILAREERAEQEALIAEERRWRQQQAMQREKVIEEERKRGLVEAEQRAERLRELERNQRRREAEQLLREKHEAELAKQLAEEKETQQLLLGLEEDRKRDRRLEIDLLLQEQQTKERLAFQRVLKEAESRIIEEEHSKFAELRGEMAAKMREEEDRLLKRHADIMARLMVERERKLWRMRQQWSAGAQAEQMASLEAEYKQHEAHMADMQRSLAAEQEAHRNLVVNLDQNLDKVNDYLHQNRGTDAQSQAAFEERQAVIDSFAKQQAMQQSQSSKAPAPVTPTHVMPQAARASAEVNAVHLHSEKQSPDVITEAQHLLRQHRDRLATVARQAPGQSAPVSPAGVYQMYAPVASASPAPRQ